MYADIIIEISFYCGLLLYIGFVLVLACNNPSTEYEDFGYRLGIILVTMSAVALIASPHIVTKIV